MRYILQSFDNQLIKILSLDLNKMVNSDQCFTKYNGLLHCIFYILPKSIRLIQIY
jgi:hypothetical protein